MKVKVDTQIEVPKAPNFFIVKGEANKVIRLCDVDKDQLRMIADSWHEKLVEKWEEQQSEKDMTGALT
ncbi:MAG: hypothetical protein H0X02_01890 [Nitrosomonas sp.]|nr:hypothetical protein [Nitrosomonas sp.]